MWNPVIEKVFFYDTLTNNWQKGDTIIKSYYSRKKLKFILEFPFNDSTGDWDDTTYYVKYTAKGKIVLLLSKEYDNSQHIFYLGFRESYVLNDQGKYSQETEFLWDKNLQAWVNKSRYLYSYDSLNNLKQEILILWDYVKGQWKDYSKKTFTYNSSGQLSSTTEQLCHDSVWVNFNKFDYFYGNNGKLRKEIWQTWNSFNATWQPYSQSIYTYDANGNLTEKLQQYWISEHWADNHKYEYRYVNNKITEMIYKFWSSDNGTWINSSREIYGYNELGFLVDHAYQMWLSGVNYWKNLDRWSWIYDKNSNLSQRLYYNGKVTTWVLGSQEFFYWTKVRSNYIPSLIAGNSPFIYPNPAYDIIFVRKLGRLKIYNSKGQLLIDKTLEDNIVDLSKLPAGIYIAWLKTKNGFFIQKFLKE